MRWERRSPRVAFVGNFENNGGSANALFGYVGAGQRLGYDVRASTLGRVDAFVGSKVPLAEAAWIPDLMVFAFETYQFLSADALATIERLIPRSRRVVIDQDGMYSAQIRVGIDTNHPSPDSHRTWADLFTRLAETILQPCLSPTTPGVRSFLYFGFEQRGGSGGEREGTRPYDLVYVGNNWYRWQDLARLCERLAPLRSRLGRIAVFGKWWRGDTLAGCEEPTRSDPAFLIAHGVETYPPVTFDQVERTMGLGRVNPVFVRPVLRELGFLTPRMFETFAADTVPLLPPSLSFAEQLYGTRVRPLCLDAGASEADTILAILERYEDYLLLTREIADELAREHSYEARLEQLFGIAT